MSHPFVAVPVSTYRKPISRRQLAENVATLRRLQSEYFRTRSPELLKKCKQLEAEVDKDCAAILAESPVPPESTALGDD